MMDVGSDIHHSFGRIDGCHQLAHLRTQGIDLACQSTGFHRFF